MGGLNLVMAANAQNPEAAWAFMQFTASGDQVKLFTRSASIPAIRMVSYSPVGKPDPYFGGQDLTALFESIGAEIPETGVLSLSWQQANSSLLKAIRQVAAGASAQTALNRAQTGITATPASK